MVTRVDSLITELNSVIVEALRDIPQHELFDDFCGQLRKPSTARPVTAETRPVVDDWLAAAVAAAPEPWRGLAQLVEAASDDIPWIVSYEHLDSTPELEAFRSFYSFTLVIGPSFRGHEPPVLREDMLVGFTLQAPNVAYPAHHHDPPEVYGVISGSLDWQVGEAWSPKGPGDVIVHRSHESHSMRTNDEPVLTWVAWPRDPHSHVYMPSFEPLGDSMEPTVY